MKRRLQQNFMRIVVMCFAFAVCYGCSKREGAESQTFTVEFNINDGSYIETALVKEGECVDKPTDLTKAKYYLSGWYSDSALTTEWDFDTAVTDNITLYAMWISLSSELDDMDINNAW